MNTATRLTVLCGSLLLCGGGLVSVSRDQPRNADSAAISRSDLNPFCDYQFVAGDLNKFNFAQLEASIRAEAAKKRRGARIEFGSVKVEHGALVVQVMFFGPDRDIQAFLYNLVPNLMPGDTGWRVARVQRLWFVPKTQLLRGLQI